MNEAFVQQLEFRLIESGIHRILQCLEQLNEEQIHFRPNSNCNSINNQILHLDGNVRQWLIASLSNQIDKRKRDEEFDSNNKRRKSELILILQTLEEDVRSVFPFILKSDLKEVKSVQCYHESIFSILVHVMEHFSYHVGQITYITKMILNIDTRYYADDDLNVTN